MPANRIYHQDGTFLVSAEQLVLNNHRTVPLVQSRPNYARDGVPKSKVGCSSGCDELYKLLLVMQTWFLISTASTFSSLISDR